MAEDKNALAELAEDLEFLKAILKWEYHPKGLEVAEKAQRIVAELAKVDNDQYGRPMFMESKCAIIKCRAIAKEGGAK